MGCDDTSDRASVTKGEQAREAVVQGKRKFAPSFRLHGQFTKKRKTPGRGEEGLKDIAVGSGLPSREEVSGRFVLGSGLLADPMNAKAVAQTAEHSHEGKEEDLRTRLRSSR